MASPFLTQLFTGAGTAAMSAASPATAALAAIPEIYKIGTGISEGIQGKRIAKGLVRPTMSIPASMQDATGMLRLNAMDTRMPGEAMILDQLQRSQANLGQTAMNAGGGSAERLAALVAGQDNVNTAIQNLGVNAATMQQNDIGALANQLNNQANVEQNAWEWNKRDKFLSDAAKAEALQNASRMNLYGGAKGLGGALSMATSPPIGGTPQVPVGSYNPADVMKTNTPYTGGFTPDATALPQRGMEFFPTDNFVSPLADYNFRGQLESMRGNQPVAPMNTKKVVLPAPVYTPFGQVPPIEQGSIFGKDRGY